MDIELDVICKRCGASLEAEFQNKGYSSIKAFIEVEPCKECLKEEYEKGRER